MNLIKQLFTALGMAVSLTTAYGVLLHDTNIDKAVLSTIGLSHQTTQADGGASHPKLPESTPHTHPHHAQLTEILRNAQARPRHLPRQSDRRHLYQKQVARGQHTLDGHHIYLDEAWQL